MRQDVDKYVILSEALAKYPFIWHRRIDAVSGGTLPDQLCRAVTGDGNSVNAKGALGCMLSHVRAWEILLAGTDAWVIVLEDDAMLRDWSDLPDIQFPAGFDVIFANNRTELAVPPIDGRRFVGLHDVLPEIEARGRAVGTDCYIISRAGAEKLLAALKADGYAGHIDLRMLAYSVPFAEAAEILGQGKILSGVENSSHKGKRPAFLRHFSMSPSLVDHDAQGETSRIREDRLGSSRQDVEFHNASRNPTESKLRRYDGAGLADPEAEEGLVAILEAPRQISVPPSAFAMGGAGQLVAGIHGTYLVRREDVLLFGPNHVVGRAGNWSCERRGEKAMLLSPETLAAFEAQFPGPKPAVDTNPRRLRTGGLNGRDVMAVEAPVFLATPIEPRSKARWMARVVPRVMQFRQYGAGRKFFCDIALDWQKALLRQLGLQDGELLEHDPGRTYLCNDLMTVEYSDGSMTVSALERIYFFELVSRLRMRVEPRPRIFVPGPGGALELEAALSAVLADWGFARIEPEALSFDTQVSVFSGARQVVCLGGAAIHPLAFCAPGTQVVLFDAADALGGHAAFLASLEVEFGLMPGDYPTAAAKAALAAFFAI